MVLAFQLPSQVVAKPMDYIAWEVAITKTGFHRVGMVTFYSVVPITASTASVAICEASEFAVRERKT